MFLLDGKIDDLRGTVMYFKSLVIQSCRSCGLHCELTPGKERENAGRYAHTCEECVLKFEWSDRLYSENEPGSGVETDSGRKVLARNKRYASQGRYCRSSSPTSQAITTKPKSNLQKEADQAIFTELNSAGA